VGNRCLAAVVRQERVGPEHVLMDGDQVKVITQQEPVRFEPHIQALCQTPKARSSLARIFRLRRETLARQIGESIMRQELKRYGLPIDLLYKVEMGDILEYFDLADLDELFLQVGEGCLRLRELIFEIKNGLYAGRETLQAPTGALNRIELASLDPACIKFSRCCTPSPTDKGLYGLLSERGLSVHGKECATIRTLPVQREDVVELLWRIKETKVEKPQSLQVLAANRNRLLMMLGAAPNEMRITEVVALQRQSNAPDWDISFEVNDLAGLKNILNHFKKLGIQFQFVLEH
ncbi:MAG: TGS domain-containing protein, partial [Desulfobulbaceae bacterium]|nr:TGS domain-containing protein [Desulfobulbaceae bacterium]